MKHDPPAIWAPLEPVLQFLKENHARIEKLFFISDGPTMQYRGKKNFFLLSTIPFRMGFIAVNWSFLEAGHGKGPADGVGATMKITADSQVARGTDIPTAKALYDTLVPLTKVKLFYVEEDEINRASTHLPKELTTIKGTLSIRQVICTTPGMIHYRVLSCFYNREAICPIVHQHCTSSTTWKRFDDITKDLLGKWCVITYDDNPYPGIMADIAEGGLEVKVMHYIGRNRFFWPRLEDKIWYTVDKVVTLIPPPENVTQRHVQISPRVFTAVCKKLNL
ncbi:hypothetical protein JOQ06_004521 [Pogonophryne albipinna]|uniref:Uncharacterized protein n=1 Tax=Pogonophryne albipinna TaxID=1090488 RepID=A0AAD6AQ95_9TELE|nr:hypothetical protein JOQ06_004521 [Pogonophryne albipinna]